MRNLVERLLLTSHNELVGIDDLPPEMITTVQPEPEPTSLDEAERRTILQALNHEHGNMAGAARRLGVSRSTIYRKMVRYGMPTEKP